jgi:hypothetical protein
MTRLAAVLLIGVVLILGTCLLDGDGPAGQELCLAFLAFTHGPDLGGPPGLTGTLVPALAHGIPLVRLDQVVPPPRA